MASLEVNPIRSATTLCHFNQTWNGSVVTHFILLSSTVTSQIERFGQIEEPATRNKERTRNKLSFFPKDVNNRFSGKNE